MSNKPIQPSHRWFFVGLGAGLFLLAVAGVWFYFAQEKALHAEAERNLTAITKLKTDQISAWREDRIHQAAELMERVFLIERLDRWLSDPQDQEKEKLLAEFRILQRFNQYSDVLLVDTTGKSLLSLTGKERPRDKFAEYLSTALRERHPVLTDLHFEPGEKAAHLSAITPLFRHDNSAPNAIGALILVNDATQFLIP